MAFYETTFIARQDVSAQEVENLIEAFSKIVTGRGGKVIKTEYWGVRSLAHIIKKNKKGHYALLGLDASPEAVKEMERNMKLHEDILRHLTIRVEKISKEPSVMMSAGDSKDDVDFIMEAQ